MCEGAPSCLVWNLYWDNTEVYPLRILIVSCGCSVALPKFRSTAVRRTGGLAVSYLYTIVNYSLVSKMIILVLIFRDYN